MVQRLPQALLQDSHGIEDWVWSLGWNDQRPSSMVALNPDCGQEARLHLRQGRIGKLPATGFKIKTFASAVDLADVASLET